MKKINLILLTILTTFTSFLASKNNDLNLTNAEENKTTSVLVNEVAYNPEGPSKFYLGDEMEHIDDDHHVEVFTRNGISKGSEFINHELLEFADENHAKYSYVMENLDNLMLSQSNTNIFIKPDSVIDLAIPYSNHTLSYLRSLSSITNKNFSVPAIIIDNIAIARFDVNPNRIKLVFDNGILNDNIIEQFYETNGNGINDRVGYGYTYFDFTLKPNVYKKIKSIIVLHFTDTYWSGVELSRNVYTNNNSVYSVKNDCIKAIGGSFEDFKIGFNNKYYDSLTSSPFDVAYFDYQNGELVFGNDVNHVPYGSFEQFNYLIYLKLRIYVDKDGDGISCYEDVEFTKMTKSEYDDIYCDGTLSDEEKASLLKNKFTYLSRLPREDEIVTGSGGLIYSYYFPYKDTITDNSKITILSMEFTDFTSFYEGSDEYYLTYICDFEENTSAFEFKYMVEEVVGIGSYEMIGVNLSDTKVYEQNYSTMTHILGNILIPGSTLILTWLFNDSPLSVNAHNNIQRLYFNCFSLDNKKLDKIIKIQFKYQQGRKDVIHDTKEDGTIDICFDPNLKIFDKTLEAKDESESIKISSIPGDKDGEIIEQQNGFYSCEENPHLVNGKTYLYFYQNVYNTDDYHDFINYWSILSYWYLTSAGTTERIITDKDGYYLTTYEGEEIVMDIDNNEPADISVDDFLKGETNGTVYDYEDGELSDTGQFWEDLENNITNFFNGVGDFFKQAGEIFLLVLGIVLGLGLVGGTSYLVIKIIDYAKVNKLVKGASNSVKKSNKTKKRRKRRKK